MANLADCSINAKAEVTPGTIVAPDRAFEFTSETLDWMPSIVQGEGLRSGSYMDRLSHRAAPVGQGGGDITMDVMSKGFGLWWQACMGSSVSTVVSGTTYQQNHTFGFSPASLTVQKTSIRADGTRDAFTLAGCVVTQFVLTFANSGLVTLQVTLDAMDYSTATAFAALTYPSSANLFHFGNMTVSTGTVTEPTTTTLGSCATPLTNVRSLTITGNRNPVVDRFNAKGTGRKDKALGTKFDVTGSMEVEYSDAVQRDAYLAQTAQSLCTTVTAGTLSTGNETLQVLLPSIKTDGGGVPQANGTGLIVQTINFKGLDNETATQAMWISTLTADAAI